MKQVNVDKLAYDPLMSFADTGLSGLHRLGATLPVVYNTEAAMRVDVDAVRKTYAEHKTSIAGFSAAVVAKNATAKDVAAYIGRAVQVLKRTLGPRYSQAWSEAGFTRATLHVKPALSTQQNVLTSLASYFTAHPGEEVADWGVTAANATTLHETATERVDALNAASVTRREAKVAFDTSLVALRSRIRHLFQELKQILPDNDPRWLDFGFNVPGDTSTPAAPEGLTAVPEAAGKAALSWNHTVNTSKFNIYQQVVGVDADPVKIGSVTATSKELSGLPTGAQVKFYVTAVNSAGESQPSAVVEIVIP